MKFAQLFEKPEEQTFAKKLSQDEVRYLSSFNLGKGFKIFQGRNGSIIYVTDIILLFDRKSGKLTDKNYQIIYEDKNLYSTEYKHLEEPEKYAMTFKIDDKVNFKEGEDLYLTCNKQNTKYSGTATLYCNYKILKNNI